MSRFSFYVSVVMICVVFGIAAEKYQFMPAPQLRFLAQQARLAINEIRGDTNTWYYVDAKDRPLVFAPQQDKIQPGLTLITGIGPKRQLLIKVITSEGQVVHQWPINWFDIWPDATHIADDKLPKGQPGTHIHGSRLMANGDIVFNFEHLGLVRLDICGNTVFRLPYATHHAINTDDNGDFWLPGQITQTQRLAQYPHYKPPFLDDTVVQVSDSGELLRQISLMAVLQANGYEGLMYLSTIVSRDTTVTGDVYHLNDVEVFPNHLAEGVFKHGDVMVSMRNINTVMVFDPQTLKVRYLSVGQFVRQHDADFIDGNHFSVYDNHHVAPVGNPNNHSKISIISALDGSVTTAFAGSPQVPFYSNIMGKHQWLENGNLLLAESMNGRAIEVDRQGQLVWQYNNLIADEQVVGIMEGAERLPAQFDQAFFAGQAGRCAQSAGLK